MKPNKHENEYIWVQELQQRMARLEKEQQAESEVEKLRLKETHWMHCPKCGQKLSTEKCGSVEIDVCPSCKGGVVGRRRRITPRSIGTRNAGKVDETRQLAEKARGA